MLFELLGTGKANARTGKELAKLYHCNIRNITEQVERERRAGKPICASTGDNPGYYLAETAEELESYCKVLDRRSKELQKTRRHLLKAII